MSIEECSTREQAWLKHAIRIAEGAEGRSRHGAIITRGGSVIGWGINRSRTHHTWVINRERELCSIHAEVQAMRASSNCVGATVYVARVNRSGVLRGSAPCINCHRTLIEAGIKKVVHT